MTCNSRPFIVFYYEEMTQQEKPSYHKHDKSFWRMPEVSCQKTFKILRATEWMSKSHQLNPSEY